jgi:predicted nucleotidyltransferase
LAILAFVRKEIWRKGAIGRKPKGDGMALRRLKKISDHDKDAILDQLKGLLHAHDEVSFALLYGSMIDPVVPEMHGDVDLAIYVKPQHLQLPEFILESKIEAEAYNLLSAKALNFPPVEVSIINGAPYSFLVNLFKGRYIVLKKDEQALTDFIDEVGAKSMANSHLRSESLRELGED